MVFFLPLRRFPMHWAVSLILPSILCRFNSRNVESGVMASASCIDELFRYSLAGSTNEGSVQIESPLHACIGSEPVYRETTSALVPLRNTLTSNEPFFLNSNNYLFICHTLSS